jgi:hypothetical protein
MPNSNSENNNENNSYLLNYLPVTVISILHLLIDSVSKNFDMDTTIIICYYVTWVLPFYSQESCFLEKLSN